MCGPYNEWNKYRSEVDAAFAIHASGGVIKDNHNRMKNDHVMIVHDGRKLNKVHPLAVQEIEFTGKSQMVYSNGDPLSFGLSGHFSAAINCWMQTDHPIKVRIQNHWWLLKPQTGLKLYDEADFKILIPEVAPMLALRTGRVMKLDPAEVDA